MNKYLVKIAEQTERKHHIGVPIAAGLAGGALGASGGIMSAADHYGDELAAKGKLKAILKNPDAYEPDAFFRKSETNRLMNVVARAKSQKIRNLGLAAAGGLLGAGVVGGGTYAYMNRDKN